MPPVLPAPAALEPVVMAVMAVVMLMMVVALSCKQKMMLSRPVGLPPTRIQPRQPVRQWRPPNATGELACSVVLIDGHGQDWDGNTQSHDFPFWSMLDRH
jgi:hypothetical protein